VWITTFLGWCFANNHDAVCCCRANLRASCLRVSYGNRSRHQYQGRDRKDGCKAFHIAFLGEYFSARKIKQDAAGGTADIAAAKAIQPDIAGRMNTA